MDYSKTDFLKDFALRTQKNLKLINKAKKRVDVYEVTQLVNSFLGLIVFPHEYGKGYIDDTYIDIDLLKKIWNGVVHNNYTNKDQTLQNLLFHIRNAIAHGRIDFEAYEAKNKRKEIHTIIFSDERNNGEQTFKIKIPINLMRKFIIFFTNKLHKKPIEEKT